MTLMTKMMMLMMHVYRKYVVFNIYNVYLYMIWRILYIFKVLLGVLCNAEYTLGHGAIKKRRATYLQYTSIPCLYHLWLYNDFYLFSLWHVFYRLHDKSIYFFFFLHKYILYVTTLVFSIYNTLPYFGFMYCVFRGVVGGGGCILDEASLWFHAMHCLLYMK